MNLGMTPEVKAKNILLGVLTLLVFLDILVTMLVQDYFTGFIRLSLTICLFYFMLVGCNWAKWMTVFLFLTASLFGLYYGFQIIVSNLLIGTLFFIFGAGLGVLALFLIRGVNINAYFKLQREP